MILFYGRLDDSPLRRAVDEAQDKGLPYAVIDQRHLAHDDLLLIADDHGISGALVVAGAEIALSAVSAVYFRPLEVPAGAHAVDDLRARTFHAGLVEWADVADCLVLSRPSAMESNSSKPFQLQAIARFLEVPATVVTSDPAEASEFRRRHGRVVFKSVSGIRSIVRELDDAAARRLDRVAVVPTLFQERVPGVDVRVHVVGDRVFATEVRSEATDYRYAARDGQDAELTATELPDRIATQCVNLAIELELPLCGIDLRHRPDDGWVCFEVNPMPAYSYYEAATGQPIAAAIVDLCASGRIPAPV